MHQCFLLCKPWRIGLQTVFSHRPFIVYRFKLFEPCYSFLAVADLPDEPID
ncbi:hypothetical protein [Leptolyngbya sp. Heron Island J]|uniref:hypothetical protein n=1 Tax=Leptolyngbya sp. Heron Island J TaxID=1385935 RepID=UPI000409C4A2|nr:hypothetical protein [Leptolyngbya sp. Heron Island J]